MFEGNIRMDSSLRSSACDKKTRRLFQSLPKTDFKFNYTNSSTYTGPIVDGWPPNISRVLEDYIPKKSDFFTILPREIDPIATELLILVKMQVDGYEKRENIRGSWGKHLTKLSPHSRTVFVLGNNKDWSNSKELQNEINIHGDILQGSFVDSYYNLTLKTISAFKFVVETIKWIHRPKIIITIDDDVFLNVPLLLKELNDLNYQCNGPYLLGGLQNGVLPRRNPKSAKKSSKWGVPSYIFADKIYPPYIEGMMSIMSFETVQCLFEARFFILLDL
ncbi:lactosylceramide 1,3-N-acetyl-beta-D-glucosaminyltransferase [Lepeophtheirus salmonis]|uniref:lactosylceramide 1,3-N-acetyl-beta-D-glucosaminyltransferase n=1 Tax=Lepeophtheirus salmonis TaxID=72036 RepID=UPI003AF358D6